MTNEMTIVNNVTGETMNVSGVIVSDTPEYTIVQTQDGKFKKNMKYQAFSSRNPETQEEKIELYKVLNEDGNENVIEMKSMIDKPITIEHVFINPYTTFDEETGKNTHGVTTTIQSEGKYYVTSSKSVYYTLRNLFSTFGNPTDQNYQPIKVIVTGTKQKNGVQINLKLA